MSIKEVEYVDYLDELHINLEHNDDDIVCTKMCNGANIEYTTDGNIIRIVCPHIQKQLNFPVQGNISVINTQYDCTDNGNKVIFYVQVGNIQPFPIIIKI